MDKIYVSERNCCSDEMSIVATPDPPIPEAAQEEVRPQLSEMCEGADIGYVDSSGEYHRSSMS